MSSAGGIFICYRRDDTAGWAGRLRADLQSVLKHVTIFQDIDTIPPGVKFDDYIAGAVGACDVLVAMIGPQWLATNPSGTKRLDEPDDFIRLEIATCLQRDIRVIPVLVGGAKLPHPEQLPDDIRALARRHAYELSDTRWASDVKTLVASLRPLVRTQPVVRRTTVLAAAAALTSLVIGGYSLQRWFGSARNSPGAVTTPLSTSAVSSGGVQETTGGRGPAVSSETRRAESQTEPPTVTYVSSGTAAGVTGGSLDFQWPGRDCWSVYRGDEKAAGSCGSAQQALQPGRYTVKDAFGVVFSPLDVTIRPGAATRVQMGGIFDFKWPGHDCWTIYRGDEKVAGGCGAGQQALQGGRYTIKDAFGVVFNPFEVSIRNGATTSLQMGGVFDFKWPGRDCWTVFRGDTKAAGGCGAGQQALQAGRYTVKDAFGAAFSPFEIIVKDNTTVTH